MNLEPLIQAMAYSYLFDIVVSIIVVLVIVILMITSAIKYKKNRRK